MEGQKGASQLIDRIVYIASLVSEPRSIDPMLDDLRMVTAKSSAPSAQDIKILQSLQAKLEDYLLHKERLRAFTPESLRTNIERHFAANNPLQDARHAALERIISTIAIAVIVTGLLVAWRLMEGQVILAFFICMLFVGLAFVFQSIKKDLVAQLQGSLNYLMAATIGTGLFALNFPIIAGSNYLQSLPLLKHGGFLEGALPVYACYYLAFYLYAKQLNVAIPALLKPAGVFMTATILALVSALLPHPVPVTNEIFFDLAVIGFGVSVYFSAVAAVLGFMTVPKTTAQYNKSTLFLAISMVLQTLGNGYFVVFVTFVSGEFLVNDQKGQILTGLLIVVALACQYIAAYKSKTSLS